MSRVIFTLIQYFHLFTAERPHGNRWPLCVQKSLRNLVTRRCFAFQSSIIKTKSGHSLLFVTFNASQLMVCASISHKLLNCIQKSLFCIFIFSRQVQIAHLRIFQTQTFSLLILTLNAHPHHPPNDFLQIIISTR